VFVHVLPCPEMSCKRFFMHRPDQAGAGALPAFFRVLEARCGAAHPVKTKNRALIYRIAGILWFNSKDPVLGIGRRSWMATALPAPAFS